MPLSPAQIKSEHVVLLGKKLVNEKVSLNTQLSNYYFIFTNCNTVNKNFPAAIIVHNSEVPDGIDSSDIRKSIREIVSKGLSKYHSTQHPICRLLDWEPQTQNKDVKSVLVQAINEGKHIYGNHFKQLTEPNLDTFKRSTTCSAEAPACNATPTTTSSDGMGKDLNFTCHEEEWMDMMSEGDRQALRVANAKKYLGYQGYEFKHELGKGGSAQVGMYSQGDKHVAIKTFLKDEFAEQESNKITELKSKVDVQPPLGTGSQTKKATDYLSIPDQPFKDRQDLLVSPIGESFDTVTSRKGKRAKEPNGKKRSWPALLRHFRQMAKSIERLHSMGYSHNDIKPGNFLDFDVCLGKSEDASSEPPTSKKTHTESKKPHKTRTKLIDFGIISPLDQKKSSCTMGYLPPDYWDESTPNTTRDVCALGVTWIKMAFYPFATPDELSDLQGVVNNRPADEAYGLLLKHGYLDSYEYEKYDESIKGLINLIKQMIAPSHTNRIDIHQVVKQIQRLAKEAYVIKRGPAPVEPEAPEA